MLRTNMACQKYYLFFLPKFKVLSRLDYLVLVRAFILFGIVLKILFFSFSVSRLIFMTILVVADTGLLVGQNFNFHYF